MSKPFWKLASALLVSSIVLSACGGGAASDKGAQGTQTPSSSAQKPEEKKAEPPKPVTLNFFYNGYSGTLIDDIKKKVAEKYPHITLNMILDAKGSTIEETIAAGTRVDLAAFSMGGLFKVMDLQLSSDLTELIKKHSFDLNRLQPGILDTVKSYSDKGEILVMPYELNNNVLIYNKNIFDKFGVPYPKDNMTWDDVAEIVKKVSRVEGGVNYKGFAYSGLNLIYKNQMGLTFVDPKTNKAAINTDQWKKWIDVMAGFHAITNNQQEGREDDHFFKTQTLAMRAGPSPLELLKDAVPNGLSWDAVTLPRFAGMNNVGSQMNAPFYAIPPSSAHRDEAFQVIAFLLSDEIQAANARMGRLPVVKSENVVKDYGVDLPLLKGTNYAKAMFADTIGKPITVTKYDGTARSTLSVALANVAQGKKDVATALRESEESINKAIEAAQAAKK